MRGVREVFACVAAEMVLGPAGSALKRTAAESLRAPTLFSSPTVGNRKEEGPSRLGTNTLQITRDYFADY